jgi:heat shock protein HtpX
MVGVMLGTIVLLADVGGRAFFWGSGRRRTSSRSGGEAQLIILVVAVVLMILAPVIAQLIYLAISRRREYLADASSAMYTRYPDGLASALEKMSRSTARLTVATRATAPMYTVNPLAVNQRGLVDLSSTHPPISERIRILRSMGAGAGLRNYDEAFRKVTGRPVGVVPFRALASAEQQGSVPPGAPQAGSRLERVRQTTDMLWRLNQYTFVACACGTTLKFPGAYLGREMACPHCGTLHRIQPTAA